MARCFDMLDYLAILDNFINPQLPGSSPGRGANRTLKWALLLSAHFFVLDWRIGVMSLAMCPQAPVLLERGHGKHSICIRRTR
jgi:hypothetical protein